LTEFEQISPTGHTKKVVTYYCVDDYFSTLIACVFALAIYTALSQFLLNEIAFKLIERYELENLLAKSLLVFRLM